MKKKYNPLAISNKTNIILNIILIIFAILAILPFLFVVMISFSREEDLIRNGYQLLPKHYSLDAYKYIFTGASQILTSTKTRLS